MLLMKMYKMKYQMQGVRGCEVASCIAVLHDVVVVGLDLQDEKVELGQGQIEEQEVQVEDEGIDESLEETLDELAILDADEEVY